MFQFDSEIVGIIISNSGDETLLNEMRTGSGLIDNVRVITATPVPEPVSVLELLAFGSLGLALKWRR